MKASSVVARSVSKTYRRGVRPITALEDVAFDLSQGELVLFVGPSGSGKTTLLNLIAALDRPNCGEIIVGELDITKLSRSAAARYRNERVGFIFQFYNLLPQLTALEVMRRNSPSCPYQANIVGFRKGSRPTLATMSLSFTRDWGKVFEMANRLVLDLMLPSLVIG